MSLLIPLDDAKSFVDLCTIPCSPTQLVVVTLTHLILLTFKPDSALLSTLFIRDVERDPKSTFKQVLFTPSGGIFDRGLCVVLTSHGHLYCFDLQGSFSHPKYVLVASDRTANYNTITVCNEYLIAANTEGKLCVMDQQLHSLTTMKFEDQVLHLDCFYNAKRNAILYATKNVIGRLHLTQDRLKKSKILAENMDYEHIKLSAETEMFAVDNLLNGLVELPSGIKGILLFGTEIILFTLDGSQYSIQGKQLSKSDSLCLSATKTAFGHVTICNTAEGHEGLLLKAHITSTSPFNIDLPVMNNLETAAGRCLVCNKLNCKSHLFDRCPVTDVLVDPLNAHVCIKCNQICAVSVMECLQCGKGTLHQPIVSIKKMNE